MYNINPILAIDSYKLGHMTMYPEGVTRVYCNITPRSSKRLTDAMPSKFYDGKIVVFGIAASVQEIVNAFNGDFFSKDRDAVINDFSEAIQPFVGDNDVASIVENIAKLHDLGYLPLRIKSLPEGSRVNAGIPILTIVNTHDDFAWLPNFLETFLSAQIWKLSTAATIANVFRRIFVHYARLTGVDESFTLFQGHDFSPRGMSGIIDAARTGSAHLTSFLGSDNISATDYAKAYYNASGFIAGSVPATEHSVMCMGTSEGEEDTFRRIFTKYPAGIVSIVSDTWDYWNTITNIASNLKPEIMSRGKDSLGFCKTVFRPDSGDPVDVIVGEDRHFMKALGKADAEEMMCERLREITPHGEYGGDFSTKVICDGQVYDATLTAEWNRYDKQYYFIDEARITKWQPLQTLPQHKGSVECLWEIFGGTQTENGYKVLDEHVGLIYGDSITPQRAVDILQGLADKGYASSNVVLGIGSYTYQHVTRDTLGFAMKATYALIDGKDTHIFKAPKTDSGKNSAKGMLRVDYVDGEYIMTDGLNNDSGGCLEVIFEYGLFSNLPTLDGIREALAN